MIDGFEHVQNYQKIRATDHPAGPVILNLGQAVAWDGWLASLSCAQRFDRFRGLVVSFQAQFVQHARGDSGNELREAAFDAVAQ